MIKRFNPCEIIVMIYAILTGLYILCFCGKIENFVWLLTNRLIIIGFVTLFAFWHNKTNNSFVFFLRFIFPPTLTSYWYPETYYLNDDVLVKNLDKFFADLDLQLFGFEPSLEFSAHYSQAWVSESMYFGYFSYFLIFAYVGIGFFLYKKNEALPVMFSIITSFFIFYLIFIFVPAAGPQFYYPASDVQVPDGYLFCNLMRSIQESGEKPTGAFPSSHVGMTLIFLYILFKHARKIFWITLPVACLLIMSTVYIKAHYLVDVLAAFLCTPFIYMASNKLYSKLL